jgi:hypothetical protein
VAACNEYMNESSGFIKCGIFFFWLTVLLLDSEEDCVPWSYL